MADIVTDLIADLTTKVQSVSGLSTQVIYIFESEELAQESNKIGVPSIGILYNNMRGKLPARNQGQLGLIATVTMDILILGGQQCVERISRETGIKTTTTALLASIRDAIKETKPAAVTTNNSGVRPQTQRTWAFVLEQPVMMDDVNVSYLQRWQTEVSLH
jgi:hypothetical protein